MGPGAMETMTAPGASRQGGFSLIELMIAALIGLILLGAVVMIAMNANQTQRELEQAGRQLENGRYAVSLLEEHIPHAGYYGDFYGMAPWGGGTPAACTTNVANIDAALAIPIQGFDSPTGNPPPTCIADGDHVDGTDILVLRRASTETTAIGSLTAGELYIQSRTNDHVLATATGSETAGSPGAFDLEKRDSTAPAEIRKLRVDIFFVSPDADDTPILTRLSLQQDGGGLGWVEAPLVAGIEQFQLDYGMDYDDNGVIEDSASGAGDAYVTAPPAGNLDDVLSVKVHLLSRTIEPVAGYSDQKVYDMGAMGAFDPADDSFRRRAFVATIRGVNAGLRRE